MTRQIKASVVKWATRDWLLKMALSYAGDATATNPLQQSLYGKLTTLELALFVQDCAYFTEKPVLSDSWTQVSDTDMIIS
jgi:hypothetical protein